MDIFDPLFQLSQEVHGLLTHWSLLCEDHSAPDDRHHTGGQIHAASLRDFRATLATARHAILAALETVEHQVERAYGMMDAYDMPLTYPDFVKTLKTFTPYLDAYPNLTPQEAMRLFCDNRLDYYYPVPPKDPTP